MSKDFVRGDATDKTLAGATQSPPVIWTDLDLAKTKELSATKSHAHIALDGGLRQITNDGLTGSEYVNIVTDANGDKTFSLDDTKVVNDLVLPNAGGDPPIINGSDYINVDKSGVNNTISLDRFKVMDDILAPSLGSITPTEYYGTYVSVSIPVNGSYIEASSMQMPSNGLYLLAITVITGALTSGKINTLIEYRHQSSENYTSCGGNSHPFLSNAINLNDYGIATLRGADRTVRLRVAYTPASSSTTTPANVGVTFRYIRLREDT